MLTGGGGGGRGCVLVGVTATCKLPVRPSLRKSTNKADLSTQHSTEGVDSNTSEWTYSTNSFLVVDSVDSENFVTLIYPR